MHRRDISAATRKRAQPSPQHVGTRTTTPQGSAQREGGTSRRKTMHERTQLAKRNRQRRANAPHRSPTGPNRSAASPAHPGSCMNPEHYVARWPAQEQATAKGAQGPSQAGAHSPRGRRNPPEHGPNRTPDKTQPPMQQDNTGRIRERSRGHDSTWHGTRAAKAPDAGR